MEISEITLFQEYLINDKKYRWCGREYLSPVNYSGKDRERTLLLKIETRMDKPYIMIGLLKKDMRLGFIDMLKDKRGVIKYRGHKRYGDEIINWVECFDKREDIIEDLEDKEIYWGLITEIINNNMIMGLCIEENVIDFLENNREYIYMCDEEERICESPIVGYDYNKELLLSKILLGCERNRGNSYMGMYYYYYNYNDIKEIYNDEFYIYKYVLFLGESKVINVNNLKKSLEREEWIEKYGSVYVLKGDICVYVMNNIEDSRLISYIKK